MSPLQVVVLNYTKRREQEVRTVTWALKTVFQFSREESHRMAALYWRPEEKAQAGGNAQHSSFLVKI